MFPRNAAFICRRCLDRFFFSEDRVNDILAARMIGCPGCNSIIDNKQGDVVRFFRFYPRFVRAVEDMKTCGMELVGYEPAYDEWNLIWIRSMTFICGNCGKESSYSLKRMDRIAAEPGLFSCKRCQTQIRPLKIVKEYFVSFRQVHRSADRLHMFLWDILSPLQLPVESFPVQWPEYGRASS